MTDAEYNQLFKQLNPQIPFNVKWTASGQRKYYVQLLADMRSRGGTQYKDPADYKSPAVTPIQPVQPIQPVINMTNITGDLNLLLYNAESHVSQIKAVIAKQGK